MSQAIVDALGSFFAILHQELRPINFSLKILHHLAAGHKISSEANPSIKLKIAASKARTISHIRASCGGLLVDSPTTV